jgi:hypothetical protein
MTKCFQDIADLPVPPTSSQTCKKKHASLWQMEHKNVIWVYITAHYENSPPGIHEMPEDTNFVPWHIFLLVNNNHHTFVTSCTKPS